VLEVNEGIFSLWADEEFSSVFGEEQAKQIYKQ